MRPQPDWGHAGPNCVSYWPKRGGCLHTGGKVGHATLTWPLPLTSAGFQGLPPGTPNLGASVGVAHQARLHSLSSGDAPLPPSELVAVVCLQNSPPTSRVCFPSISWQSASSPPRGSARSRVVFRSSPKLLRCPRLRPHCPAEFGENLSSDPSIVKSSRLRVDIFNCTYIPQIPQAPK